MTSSGSRLVSLGLRGSGKTSYLAALWHLVEAGELPTSLTVATLQPDRTYLNRIRDAWLSFQEVGRTSLRGEETVSLVLRERLSGAAIDITLPDLSGESFRLQWANRKVARSYAEYVRECRGVLLFVHPGDIRKGLLIDHDAEVKANDDAGGMGQARPWSPATAPTQVQLVELLQFVKWLRASESLLHVAVIVSAWDVIRETLLPSAWIELRLPLLAQFLRANSDDMPFRIFGVSALGGDLKKDVSDLESKSLPSHRIRVIENDLEYHHDLSAPVRFLLGIDTENVATPKV